MMEQSTLPISDADVKSRGPLVGPRLFFVAWVIIMDVMALGELLRLGGEAALPPLPAGAVFAADIDAPGRLAAALRTLPSGSPVTDQALRTLGPSMASSSGRTFIIESADDSGASQLLLWQGPAPYLEETLALTYPGSERMPLPDGDVAARLRPSKSQVSVQDEQTSGLQKAQTPDGDIWYWRSGSWNALSTSADPFLTPWSKVLRQTKESAYFRTFRTKSGEHRGFLIIPNPIVGIQKIWL